MTKLKYYRIQLNLSIKYIAGACGVSFVDVVDWEYSGKAPNKSIRILSKIYGVKKKDLDGEVPAIDYDEKQIKKLKEWKKQNVKNLS